MMKNRIFFLLAVIWLAVGASFTQALPSNFQVETLITGLGSSKGNPVYLAQLPDGRMLLLRKKGRIEIFDPTTSPAAHPVYMILTDIEARNERGLTSIALDPNFEQNGYFYLYYTNASSARNRISRFTHNGNTGDESSEVVIWEDNEDWSDCCHYGGGLAFGPDGKLYLTTGEEFDGNQAQDLTRAGGKIIRINTNGTIPANNPFVDGPGGNLDEIWAYGLRNPYRAYWDLVDERLYIAEVGGNVQQTAREDIHIGRKGANYGWPFCEGQCNNQAYDSPVYDYGHTGGTPDGGAVTVGFVYRGNKFPATYDGVFFFSDYVLGWIKYLVINPDGSLDSVNDFATNIGAAVHLIQGQDGALYFVDYLGSVKRIVYNSGNQPPAITAATATPVSGAAPLNVDFSASATDQEGDSLSYNWVYGDGQEGSGANSSHTYSGAGSYSAYVEVSDSSGTTVSDPILIQVGTPPVVSIDLPIDGALFRAGDTVSFSATATDPDGTLSPADYYWDILFVHNAHIHPGDTATGTSGQLTINTQGHDYHDDTAYQINLTVTDSDGLTTSDVVTVYPDKVNVTLATVPAGLPVFLDGIQLATPIVYDTAIDFQHVISVQLSVCDAGVLYGFDRWSDGGSATHQIVVPDQPVSYTAEFSVAGACGGLPDSGLVLHLESDAGLTVSGNAVTAWADQSGQGNDLTAAGDPTRVVGAPSGAMVVDFDGAGDKLQRTAALNGLPVGSADRTVYLVANYRGTGYGGFAYGNSQCNKTFGAIVDPAGGLMVQGWCNAHDFVSGTQGTGSGWLVQSVVLASDQLSHYRDGALIDSRSHTYNTVLSKLVLGAEIDGTPLIDMQVAAVLVYNRALSPSEQSEVLSYLQGKYIALAGTNQPPVAADDTTTVASSGSVEIGVLNNDSDDSALNPASVEVTQEATEGDTAVNTTTGVITYIHSGGTATSDTFKYRVKDDAGLWSNAATVTLSIAGGSVLPANGLVLHLESDVGVVVAGNTVTAWADQSGQGNDLTAAGDPTRVVGAPSGAMVVDFDGAGDKLERTAALNGLPVGGADRTVYMVANYHGTGYGGFAYGTRQCNKTFGAIVNASGKLMVQGWCNAHDFASGTQGTGSGWLVQSVVLASDQLSHYRDGALIDSRSHTYNTVLNKMVLGAEIDGTPFIDMQVAAVLVYDRALSTSEQSEVLAYLQAKYITSSGMNQPPVANDDPNGSVLLGGSVLLDVLGNDVDADDGLDITSVIIEDGPTYGVATVDEDTGEVDYIHGGASELTDTFTYRVADLSGVPSNLATVSIAVQYPDASVTISSPEEGAVIQGSTVEVHYSLSGVDYDHLHLTLDDLGHNTIRNLTGSFTFTDVAAGAHTVSAHLVDSGHQMIGTPESMDSVSFTVAADGGAVVPSVGLVLHLESDTGLEVSGGIVAAWEDQSGQGNDLTAAGDPTLVVGAPSGAVVVDFDGAGDKLERTAALNGLPVGGADRTVYMVANYHGTGYGGFAYGKRQCNKTFGAIVNAAGKLMVQGWCNAHDFASGTQGTGSGWLVQSVVLASDQLSHYRDGALIDSRSHTYNTVLDKLVLGVEIDGAPFIDMRVAAVLVYNRALSTPEQSEVLTYLQDKYITQTGLNQPPVAVDDAATVASNMSVLIDVLSNDSDDSALTPSTVEVTLEATEGDTVVNTTTGAITYTHNDGAATSDTFEYQVQDGGGLQSNTATVTLTITDNNQPPVAVDDLATVTQNGLVEVDVLANDTDEDGGLDQTTVTVTVPPLAGSAEVAAGTGVITYTHSGGLGSDTLNYKVQDDGGVWSNEATVDFTITSSGVGLPANGLVLHLEADVGVSASGGVVTAWADQSARGNDLTATGDPALVATAPSGALVVAFDGTGDKLQRTAALNGLPAGSADRTVYLVANYHSTGVGGFSYGHNRCNKTFGTVVDTTGKFMVQGWCNRHDFASGTQGTGSGWFVQSVVLASNQLSHYRDGAVIDSRPHTYNTVLRKLVLGAEIDSSPFVDMEVAAVLVYDRALTASEQTQVLIYLQDKYLTP